MSAPVKSSAFVRDSLAAFRRGAVDLLEERELVAALERAEREKRGLRVKFGMDPSSPDLHVGHAVVLLKLRDLQRLGHTIVLIVGDATAMVGDPSGRNKLRPQLTRAEVNANLGTYTSQAGILLDMKATEVRRNSEWFDAMRFEDLLRLLGRRTVAQTLAREDFQKRLSSDAPIGLHELVYPVMQGWDSVEVRAEVEFGGTDQLFNLLVGRDLQVQSAQIPQVVVTTPLVNGLDGRKMSKSYGNTIGLTDSPKDVFGKTMRVPDEAVPIWLELLTRVDEHRKKEILAKHPREAKEILACHMVSMLYGDDEAERQRSNFIHQFSNKEVPDEMEEAEWPLPTPKGLLPALLEALGLANSRSNARQKIKDGGVDVDEDKKVTDVNYVVDGSAYHVIRVGHRYRRVKKVRIPPT